MSNPKVESEREKEIDPSIDITSEHFDPLKALYSENVNCKYKNAKVYDNISQFESLVMRSKKTGNEATTSTSILSNTRTNTSKVNKFSASDEPVIRRFLPHQRKTF